MISFSIQPSRSTAPKRYLLTTASKRIYVANGLGSPYVDESYLQAFSAQSFDLESAIYVAAVDHIDLYQLLIDDQYLPDANEHWISLWDLMIQSEPVFHLAGRAVQLFQWFDQHRFCGRCGQPSTRSSNEHAMYCNACGLRQYPKIAPCVIMLIQKGEYCLLAQRPQSPHERYTVLAGFLEAGESAEAAVVREVFEETGLSIHNLHYFCSQAWHFPGQIMLGYRADYLEGALIPDEQELQNANWFHYTDLPAYPPQNTIAGRLILDFVKRCSTV